jgi:hypothetical protein
MVDHARGWQGVELGRYGLGHFVDGVREPGPGRLDLRGLGTAAADRLAKERG